MLLQILRAFSIYVTISTNIISQQNTSHIHKMQNDDHEKKSNKIKK